MRDHPFLVICVDGATPGSSKSFDSFTFDGQTAPRPLQSIYPSSTAPAHASMMTGVFPERHGIVANRYWDNDADDVVALSRGDPIATLHPYEYTSLGCPSLVDALAAAGLGVAGVQFPHAFARSPSRAAVDGVYCVYLPAETRRLHGGADEWRFELAAMGFDIAVAVRPDPLRKGGRIGWHATPLSPATWVQPDDEAIAIFAYRAGAAISFALTLNRAADGTVMVARSTAAVAITCGDIAPADAVQPGRLPHSAGIDYDANPDHRFHETPTVRWVTETALEMLAHDPDVLFVRYPQIDHAQELLVWLAAKGTPAEQRDATEQLRIVYRQVHENIARLRAAVGAETPGFLFSDHGIAPVDRHIHLNSLLAEAGLAGSFVFQGDSSCAFLYGSRALRAQERARLEHCLRTFADDVWIAQEAELRGLRLFHPSRCGRLAVRCPPHSEFQYGDGPIVAAVRSASHGFSPELPAMQGIWAPLAGERVRRAAPHCLTDLATIVLDQCVAG